MEVHHQVSYPNSCFLIDPAIVGPQIHCPSAPHHPRKLQNLLANQKFNSSEMLSIMKCADSITVIHPENSPIVA